MRARPWDDEAAGMWRERIMAWAARIERFLLPPVMEPGAMPFYQLAYLAFPFLPLLVRDFPQPNWLLTVAATLAFLPIYFLFFWVRGWRRLGLLFSMALLGLALMPANYFGNTFLVYSNVLTACLPLWQMALVVVVTQALAAGLVLMSNNPELAQLFVGVNLVTCVLAAVCSRYWLATARRNHVLRLSQEEIRRLAQVAERERIGRDLHDLLGHTLSVVAIKSELAAKLFGRDAAAAQREIADVERIAREALGQVRRAVSGMRAVGLRAEFASARLALAAVSVDFEYTGPELPLHAETETVLALALREATTNVIRHSGAHRCNAELTQAHGNVQLRIHDDGQGGARADGNGLSGMRERIEAAGGSLIVESPVGAGTTLTVSLPYRAPSTDPVPTTQPRPRLQAVR